MDWLKRIFDGSDLPHMVSWKEFIEKGYYIVPPDPADSRAATAYNWYNEGRKKDVPEPFPLPADYTEDWLQ